MENKNYCLNITVAEYLELGGKLENIDCKECNLFCEYPHHPFESRRVKSLQYADFNNSKGEKLVLATFHSYSSEELKRVYHPKFLHGRFKVELSQIYKK